MTAATAPLRVTPELDPSSSDEDSTPDFEKDGDGDAGGIQAGTTQTRSLISACLYLCVCSYPC